MILLKECGIYACTSLCLNGERIMKKEKLSDITGLMPNDVRSESLDEAKVIKVRPNKVQLKF